MSSILVTGAAGFIGSQILHAFSIAGDDVVGIDNFSYGYEDNLVFEQHNLIDKVLNLDIRDQAAVEALFVERKFDYLYHCAAITPLPDCQINIPQTVEVNVTGTAKLLDLAKDYHIKKVVFASTSAVYENETEFPSVEKLEVQPSLMYSNSKVMGERLCKTYADCYDLPVTIMRFANVYGPRMDCLRVQPPVVAYLIREFYYGRVPILHGNGEQQRDFVYSEDLVELAQKVQTTKGFDIVNVSSNTPHSINDMYLEVARAMGKEGIEPQYADTKHFWQNYPALFEPVAIKDSIMQHEIDKYTQCDNSYAKNTYGWQPSTTLAAGIQKCVTYTVQVLENLE